MIKVVATTHKWTIAGAVRCLCRATLATIYQSISFVVLRERRDLHVRVGVAGSAGASLAVAWEHGVRGPKCFSQRQFMNKD